MQLGWVQDKNPIMSFFLRHGEQNAVESNPSLEHIRINAWEIPLFRFAPAGVCPELTPG